MLKTMTMPSKKVILIDDEPLARMLVREYLQAYPQLEVVQECEDGFEGVKAVQQHKPDLLFLDIQMPRINGFEMLELLEQPPAVIFTTAFDEFALKAFEAHAIDYLLKPFSRERFDAAVRKWIGQHEQPVSDTPGLLETASRQPAQSNRIVVKSGSHIRIIPLSEVLYLEAADDFVKVHTAAGHFLKSRTMAHFEQVLPAGQFCRCHRSYLLNVQQITRIDPWEKDGHIAILKNGVSIPVSRTGYVRLREVLGL